jgi:uncharacterized protein YgiB involved in biofilm formation
MRNVIFAFMLAGLGVMVWLFFRGECPGGKVFANEAACQADAGFDATFCRQSFASARRRATLDYPPFPNQNDCLMQFPRCEPHARIVGGFVPVPRGVCVAQGHEGDPIYARYGQRIGPN